MWYGSILMLLNVNDHIIRVIGYATETFQQFASDWLYNILFATMRVLSVLKRFNIA